MFQPSMMTAENEGKILATFNSNRRVKRRNQSPIYIEKVYKGRPSPKYMCEYIRDSQSSVDYPNQTQNSLRIMTRSRSIGKQLVLSIFNTILSNKKHL